jgi:hypothetical protein
VGRGILRRQNFFTAKEAKPSEKFKEKLSDLSDLGG